MILYRGLLVGSLCYLVASALFQHATRHHHIDFKQYYLGAWVARAGMWDVLYPDPTPGGLFNAGLDGSAKPAFHDLSARVGAGEPAHFIQPPPAALLIAPLAWLSYPVADRVWTALAAIAAWGAAVLGGRIVRLLSGSGGPTLLELGSVLLVALHPRTLLQLTAGNVSPFVGLAIAGAVYGLVRGRPVLAVIGTGIAAVLKVTPLVLISLLWVRFPPRLAFGACVGMAAAVLGSALITGVRPWVEFATRIAPTLSRPWLPVGTTGESELMTGSVHAIAWWAVRLNPLPPGISLIIALVSVAVLLALLALVALCWSRGATGPEVITPAAFALIAWTLMFAPIFWGHYFYYYAFGTGWLLYRLGAGPAQAVAAASALFFLWAPWGRLPPFSSVFVGNLVPLFAVSCILVCGFLGLLEAARRAHDAEPRHSGPRVPGIAGATPSASG